MKNWNRRKAVVSREEMPEEHRLRQSLGWPHLVALGVGAIVGVDGALEAFRAAATGWGKPLLEAARIADRGRQIGNRRHPGEKHPADP